MLRKTTNHFRSRAKDMGIIFRRMIGGCIWKNQSIFFSVLIEDTIDYGFEWWLLSSNNNGVLIFVSPFTIILVRLHMWSVFTVAMQPNCHDQVKYSLVKNLWVSLESSFIFNQFKNLHVVASLLKKLYYFYTSPCSL